MQKALVAFALVSLLVAAAAVPAGAVTVSSITFTDPAATSMDFIRVDVSGTSWAPDSCFDEANIQSELVPGYVLIELVDCNEGSPGEGDPPPFTFSTTIGPLPAGTYDVDVQMIFGNALVGLDLSDAPLTVPDPPDEALAIQASAANNYTVYCPAESPPQPCNLLSDLFSAVQGGPTIYGWHSRLDPTYNSWRSYGSLNMPVLAEAIALVTDTGAAETNDIAWWTKFLDCQNGDGCTVSNPGSLAYFKGGEVLSNTYDAMTNSAILGVNYWAATHNATLATKARKYLKATWTLYALGAGNGPAGTFADDSVDQSGSRVHTCQTNARGQYFYSGPFLALAGGRSPDAHSCQDDRGPFFARAISWSPYASTRESPLQVDYLAYLQSHWPGNAFNESVYGVDPTYAATLRSQISSGQSTAALLPALHGFRSIRELRFLGWSDGSRASILQNNPNTADWNTAALFGVLYTPSKHLAHMLFPWGNRIRRMLTAGYGKLTPDGGPYTGAAASNIGPGETANNFNPLEVVSMAIPTTGRLFYVLMSPTADAALQP